MNKPYNNSKSLKIPKNILSEHEKTLLDLTLGRRDPVTADEKELARDIADIRARGREVEIPNEIGTPD